MKNTPAVQKLLDKFALHRQYITFNIVDSTGQDDLVHVSTQEAAREITRHGGKLQQMSAPDDLAHKYAALKGWKSYRFSIGLKV